jgi:hypothetical protein
MFTCCCCCCFQELLVPVPTQLFQGSLLLGSITRLALGPEALARPDVLISPLVIAGEKFTTLHGMNDAKRCVCFG